MFRMLLRLIGLCLLAIAFTTLVLDITHSLSAKQLLFTETGTVLSELAPTKLAAAHALIEQHISPILWDALLARVMRLPLWLTIGAAGGLIAWLAQSPAPKFGFSGR